MDERHVVVTTEWRGVFFGRLAAYDKDKRRCTLADVRCALYWSTETKGFLGLSQTGPISDSRISQTAPAIELHGVTSVVDCTEKAVEAWKAF